VDACILKVPPGGVSLLGGICDAREGLKMNFTHGMWVRLHSNSKYVF
jgi:hypothetical protein